MNEGNYLQNYIKEDVFDGETWKEPFYKIRYGNVVDTDIHKRISVPVDYGTFVFLKLFFSQFFASRKKLY